jgi:phage replication O-like protein O
MSTALYNNACAPALANTDTAASSTSHLSSDPDHNAPVALDIIEGNRLHLLSEHSVIIYRRCLDQLAICQLSPRYIRVFCIILNQTIGHGKLEDNSTSTRLEQLTQIRHDHAAQAMKDLAAMNIIIHRAGGKYHNWLSINFNFATWGKATVAEYDKSNNPALLLPKKYTETPIDNGLQLDPTKLQNTADYIPTSALNNPLEPVETTHCEATNTAKTPSKTIQNTKAIETDNISTKSAKKIEAKLTTLLSKKLSSALENINQTLQGFEKHLSTALSSQISTAVIKESSSQIEQNQDSKNTIQTPSQKSNTQQSDNQETKAVVVASSNYSIEIAPFNYPEKLDKEQCQALQGLLIKSGSRAQDLLNLLAQRLRNTKNPVADPASYFASLVYKYKKNQLDFSGLRAIKAPKSAKEKAQKEHFDALKIHHRSCYNDYLHFQRIVEADMKQSQLSFKEVCQNSPLGGIIEDCGNKLLKAKQALDDFLANDEVIVA